ncbi:dienelactone hydrolase family protein [Streptomyces sp. UG1]|uniref:dienelactone hydrolase family protein n=1 Tax=Streptomyces sp. UG1 TaxID=3417652 RepID=UPI003CFBB3CC
MQRSVTGLPAPAGTGTGRAVPRGRSEPRRLGVALLAAIVGMITAVVAMPPASAHGNPYERGPDPTVESVAAERGTFATDELDVEPGHGFNGWKMYYPKDTGLGTRGAVAVVPGYTASWKDEGAWMGHWIASFGFVVIGIDTNSPTDRDDARGRQLLAALDYLTEESPVAGRVDPDRLGVMGHSMGGGGTIHAATQRPELQAAVLFAPASFSQDLSGVKVPTMVMGAIDDPTVTPEYLDELYATLPADTPGSYVQLSSGSHAFPTSRNISVTRLAIPWLKIFIDHDTRYTQFLCPDLADTDDISRYENTCPYEPTTEEPPPVR